LFHRSWINSRSTFKGEGAPDVALVDPSPADLRAKTMARRPPVGLEELREYFHKPEKQVAVELGMCLTSLKKICRNLGVHRWPHRKVTSALDQNILHKVILCIFPCHYPLGLLLGTPNAAPHVLRASSDC
jgi:hypothetical protein